MAAALVMGCTLSSTPGPGLPDVGVAYEITPDLHVRGLAPGIWLHTTYRLLGGQVRFPSNGLIVEAGRELYLVDSAWGEEETRTLVEWLGRATAKRLTLMVSTHHHADRVSGSGFLQHRGIRVLAHPQTGPLAASYGIVPPEPLDGMASVGAAMRIGPLEIFYPGPAHAADNIVVWVPSHGVLFGGCAVRPADSAAPGNTDDADVENWPSAIEKVLERYRVAEIVVPGHGVPGGTELLSHTIAIFRTVSR